ncbi:expressed unknown protein [Seminavis robusta]|uniref:Uncharacterized protein n=1 Tax=Seminavis robusta TaxID=568900 RepID=A0A9N8HNM0_9STRA|nr:expressed unknown protein [Seminavis robusta]|eukprot:Sro997_g229430.1 n/a (327) ;mRNA; f:19495-20475
MKLSTFTTATLGLTFAAADNSHEVASSYNTLFYYDASEVTNSYFVGDIMNSTSLAFGHAIKAFEIDSINELSWEALEQNMTDTLGNIGRVVVSSPERHDLHLCAANKATVTVHEAIAAGYDSLDGPDSQELGSLLTNDQHDAAHADVDKVLTSWISRSDCLIDGDSECVWGDEDSASIMYLQQGSSESDLTMQLYTFYFSHTDAADKQAMVDVSLNSVVVTGWSFNQDVYSQVRSTVSEKIDIPRVQDQVVAPTIVPDNGNVQSFFKSAEFVPCKGGENLGSAGVSGANQTLEGSGASEALDRCGGTVALSFVAASTILAAVSAML